MVKLINMRANYDYCTQNIKARQRSRKPGSVSYVARTQVLCHLSSLQVALQLKRSTLHRYSSKGVSGGNPPTMVYMNLQPPADTAQMITHWLVVSYTTFSPLPTMKDRRLFSSTLAYCHQ